MQPSQALILVSLLAGALSCASPSSAAPRFAHLDGASSPEFDTLRSAFREANPGYDLRWHPSGSTALSVHGMDRAAFVQDGEGSATVEATVSPVSAGDLVLVRAGERLELPRTVGALVFDLPGGLPPSLPSVIRPDWDPLITDVPGGCATEAGAYRRILLTWLEMNGPYVAEGINAHRVRITDSFTHYHPKVGGFDEFYLVQMAGPEAQLYTSTRVDEIESGAFGSRGNVAGFIESHPLRTGDLVYLPRGVAHRGVGGALVQVITVPGFRPGAEVGLDHHLKMINERFGLGGAEALPVHAGVP